MSNFIDYISNKGKKSLSLPAASSIESKISPALDNLPNIYNKKNEKNKFTNDVSKLAVSQNILNELSDAIDIPRDNETEDEFVERAKKTFFNILKNKINK